MNPYTPLPQVSLSDVRIASPCRADWDLMEGDDVQRHCQQCRKSVYNVSAMTQEQAKSFLRSRSETSEGTCVRMYRRYDGTVLTADCPVGARLRRWRFAGLLSLAATALGLGFFFRSNVSAAIYGAPSSPDGCGTTTGFGPDMGEALMGDVVFTPVQGKVAP